MSARAMAASAVLGAPEQPLDRDGEASRGQQPGDQPAPLVIHVAEKEPDHDRRDGRRHDQQHPGQPTSL